MGPPTLAWPLQTWPGRHGWPGRRGAKVTVPYMVNSPSELMFKDGTPNCKVLDESPFQKNDLMFKLDLFVSGGVHSKSSLAPPNVSRGGEAGKRVAGQPSKSLKHKNLAALYVIIYIYIYIWVICFSVYRVHPDHM